MENVNVTNVLDVSALDLALWIATQLETQVPRPGPNYTVNIQADILPVMADLANKLILLTELYIIVVGATPTQTSLRTSGGTDTKVAAEVLGRKKDCLYRALQTLEAVRETASRMITGSQQPRGFNG